MLKVDLLLVQISQRLGNRHIGRENRPASRRRNYLEYPSRPPMLGEGAHAAMPGPFGPYGIVQGRGSLLDRPARTRTSGITACMAFNAWYHCLHSCVIVALIGMLLRLSSLSSWRQQKPPAVTMHEHR